MEVVFFILLGLILGLIYVVAHLHIEQSGLRARIGLLEAAVKLRTEQEIRLVEQGLKQNTA